MKQPQFVFHKDAKYATEPHLPEKPSLQQCLEKVSPDNPNCMLNKYVGQTSAKRKMARVLVSALQRYNHQANEVNWLLTGPSSVGKTTLAKLFAKILQLPFIEINPTSINKLDEILLIVKEVLDRARIPLTELKNGTYKLPPCVIFIDEAHSLKKNIQNGLLKAIERADRQLVTESKNVVSTVKVTFMMATTDVGDLNHALINRFTEIALKPYTRKEIAEIVKIKYPHLDVVPCAIAAYFEPRIPRKAIEFAQEMIFEKQSNPQKSWTDVGLTIAKENDIDEMGMPNKHVKILASLIKNPVSKDNLANILNIRPKELTEFIIPWLIADSENCPALITVSTSGYKLTMAGFKELRKRKITLTIPKYLEEDLGEEETTSTEGVPDIPLELVNQSGNNAFTPTETDALELVCKETKHKDEEEQQPLTVIERVESAIKKFIKNEIMTVGVNVLFEAAKRVI